MGPADDAAEGPELGPLSRRVDTVAGHAAASCAGPALEAVRAVRDRLAEPPRVALVGRVSSGKSTLLNALLGARVASTAAGECTRTTTWYRYGRWTAVQAVARDGRRVPVRAPAQGPLAPSPSDADEMHRIEVTAPAALLRKFTLIDTPGLTAASSDRDEQTRDLLAERSFTSPDGADVLVLVLSGPVRGDELAAVAAFLGARPDADAVCVGVMSKADLLGDDPRTSWERAVELSEGLVACRRSSFATVVPVVGLLAQTGAVGLSQDQACDLDALARDWDADTAALAVQDVELFCTLDAPVPAERRRGLTDAVGLYGAAALLSAAGRDDVPSAAALSDVALQASGLPSLLETLDATVTARADTTKASRAVTALRSATYLPGADTSTRDEIERLLLSDAMLPVHLVRVQGLVARGRVRLPDALERQLLDACSPAGLPTVTRSEAVARAGEWRTWALHTSEAGRRVADVMARAWHAAGAAG